jgi:hypothetical protein
MLLAHYSRETGEKESLSDHSKIVAENMKQGLSPASFPHLSSDLLEKLLIREGRFHDVGKAMRVFQDYLKTGAGGIKKITRAFQLLLWHRFTNFQKKIRPFRHMNI